MKHQEKIMVVPQLVFTTKQLQEGLQSITHKQLTDLTEISSYRVRDNMENNLAYKQLIPYVYLVNNQSKILTYKRSKKGGEGRLYDKYSIGVGGHIDEDLESKCSNPFTELLNSTVRELEEELGLKVPNEDLELIGSIYDDSNDVGKVHFGVVFKLVVDEDVLTKGETNILIDREFLSKKELLSKYKQLENWTKIIVDQL